MKTESRVGRLCRSWVPQAQEIRPPSSGRFQKQVPEQIAEIAAQHPDKKIVVFFQDECRFGQQGTLTRKWAKRGSRPTAVRQTEYNDLWVIAAASPQTGQAPSTPKATPKHAANCWDPYYKSNETRNFDVSDWNSRNHIPTVAAVIDDLDKSSARYHS